MNSEILKCFTRTLFFLKKKKTNNETLCCRNTNKCVIWWYASLFVLIIVLVNWKQAIFRLYHVRHKWVSDKKFLSRWFKMHFVGEVGQLLHIYVMLLRYKIIIIMSHYEYLLRKIWVFSFNVYRIVNFATISFYLHATS